MIDRLKALLTPSSSGRPKAASLQDKPLACAALMAQAAILDGHFDETERALVRDLVQRRFGLNAEEAGTLIEAGLERAEGSNHLLGFTRTIKERFDESERIALMDMLWDVVFADGVLHDYEANLMRRIAGLIYVSDRDNGAARKRAKHRAGLADED